MFDKIEYELLYLKYMPKDEYKKLIKTYMSELNIPRVTANNIHALNKRNNLNMKII